VLAALLKDLKKEVTYIMDPVLGDDDEKEEGWVEEEDCVFSNSVCGFPGRLYVPPEIIPVMKAHIFHTRPTILTPNAFEAALLTSSKPLRSLSDALKAMDCLHAMGAQTVVITSSWIKTGNESPTPSGKTLLVLASTPWKNVSHECGASGDVSTGIAVEAGGRRRQPLFPSMNGGGALPPEGGEVGFARFALRVPLLRAAFTGTGDLTAALLLANSTRFPQSFAMALESTIASVYATARRTLDFMSAAEVKVGDGASARVAACELRVVESLDDFRAPVLLHSMQAFPLDSSL